MLDAARGIAALMVFISHLRALFFVDYNSVARPGILIQAIYILTGFGHEAVVIFFVLSGFLIAGSVYKADASGRWDWTRYCVNRLVRLYVVLIPALLIGAMWDRLGIQIFGSGTIYGGIEEYRLIVPEAVNLRAIFSVWLGNAFFLQSILCPPFGTNGPLWSLSYEFWYYVIFPLGYFMYFGKLRMFSRIASGVLMLSLLIFVGNQIALYFLIWLIGALLAILPVSKRKINNAYVICSVVLVAVSLLFVRSHRVSSSFINDLCVGTAFALMLYLLLSKQQLTIPKTIVSVSRFTANISYTLYLTHLPFLVFLNAYVIGSGSRWQPSTKAFILSSMLAIMTLLYTRLLWWCTEARTDYVRTSLTNLQSIWKKKFPQI